MTGDTNAQDRGHSRSTSATPDLYEIHFKGHLGDRWASRFSEFELIRRDDGTTELIGPVVDQAALYGLIGQVRDLGLELISVNKICKEG